MNGDASPSQQVTDAKASRAGAITAHAGGGGRVSSEAAAAEVSAFFAGLLERQCGLVGGVAGVVYLAGSEARGGGVAAVWERGHSGTNGNGKANGHANGVRSGPGVLSEGLVKRLARLGAEVSSSGQGRAEGLTLDPAEGRTAALYQVEATHTALAQPLIGAGQTHGASVILAPRNVVGVGQERGLLATLALTVSEYEAFLWRQHSLAEAHAKTRLRETLELLDAAQKGGDTDAMGGIFCHELARRFGCTRVSVGLVRGRSGRIRLAAVSGADALHSAGGAAEALENAMEECADQDIEIVYPPLPLAENDPSQRRVTRAHEELSRRFGPSAILSLPLRVEGDLVGVVTMERDAADPFPTGAVPLLRLAAEYMGPALWTRRMADRGVLAVARDRAIDLAVATVGPRHTGAKAIATVILLALLAITIVPIPGRVSGEGEVTPARFRIIPAPYQGRLAEVLVRPGDSVSEGDVLALMDVRDLRLELAQARNERARLQAEYNAYMSGRDMARAAITSARIDELDPQIELLEYQIADATIVSPLSGHVSRGDNESLLGAVVDPTTPLFEVVGLDESIVVVQVNERDIAILAGALAKRREAEADATGSARPDGWFAPASDPGLRLPMSIETIRPRAEAVRGANVYLVEARVTEVPPDVTLLPGETGKVRLRTGTTTIMATVLRPLIDEARLRLWW